MLLTLEDKQLYPEHWPQFYTATISNWQHLLNNNDCKNIIIESLQFLVNDKRIKLYGFVLMSNHIHLIWQPLLGNTPSSIQSSFMKYTAQQVIRYLQKIDVKTLETLKVIKRDRTYQVWKREALSLELRSSEVFNQKLNYIHYNPVKAGLCLLPEEYYYSSAKFYNSEVDVFNILSHYIDS